MFDIVPFKSFIDLVVDSTKTIELMFNQNELTVSLLNNSHVCFYDAVFKKEFFDYYKVDGAESIVVDTGDLFKILKSSKATDELQMESDDAHLLMRFESKDGNRRIFELPLIDLEYESPKPPQVPHDLDFLVEISKLIQCSSDLDKIVNTDRFKFVVSDDGVSVTAPDDSMTGYRCELDETIIGDCSVNVNTSYVSGLNKLSKVNGIVELGLGSNVPLSWKISSKTEDVVFKGLIAPIIEDNG